MYTTSRVLVVIAIFTSLVPSADLLKVMNRSNAGGGFVFKGKIIPDAVVMFTAGILKADRGIAGGSSRGGFPGADIQRQSDVIVPREGLSMFWHVRGRNKHLFAATFTMQRLGFCVFSILKAVCGEAGSASVSEPAECTRGAKQCRKAPAGGSAEMCPEAHFFSWRSLLLLARIERGLRVRAAESRPCGDVLLTWSLCYWHSRGSRPKVKSKARGSRSRAAGSPSGGDATRPEGGGGSADVDGSCAILGLSRLYRACRPFAHIYLLLLHYGAYCHGHPESALELYMCGNGVHFGLLSDCCFWTLFLSRRLASDPADSVLVFLVCLVWPLFPPGRTSDDDEEQDCGAADASLDMSMFFDEDVDEDERMACDGAFIKRLKNLAGSIEDGTEWTAASTCGDGACALHSLWGVPTLTPWGSWLFCEAARDMLLMSLPVDVGEVLAGECGVAARNMLEHVWCEQTLYAMRCHCDDVQDACGAAVIWRQLADDKARSGRQEDCRF